MKMMCERCLQEYVEGEIYPSKHFKMLFCTPCENEYESSLQNFRLYFLNNQPERLSEKTSKEDAIV